MILKTTWVICIIPPGSMQRKSSAPTATGCSKYKIFSSASQYSDGEWLKKDFLDLQSIAPWLNFVWTLKPHCPGPAAVSLNLGRLYSPVLQSEEQTRVVRGRRQCWVTAPFSLTFILRNLQICLFKYRRETR